MMKNRILAVALALVVTGIVWGQAKVKVACVGNSITYGYGIADREHDSYPAQLQQLLGPGYEVGNFGRSGATLLNHGHRPYMQMEEYRQAIEFAGDIVVIHLGINDTDPRDWPDFRDEFIGDYLQLIANLREVNPQARVLIARLSPIGVHHARFESGTRDWRGQIQDAIAIVARKAQVQLIDFEAPLYPYPHLLPDNLHPDVQGAGILAKTVYQAITGNYGGLQMPAIYTDHMVLQYGEDITLRGTANAGQTVTLTITPGNVPEKTKKTKARAQNTQPFVPMGPAALKNIGTAKPQHVTATADTDGHWQATLQALRAGGPYTLTVEDSETKLTYTDILAGDVWVCSGQSNMAFMMKEDDHSADYIAGANSPLIRFYDMKPRWLTYNVEWDESVLDSVNNLQYFRPTQWAHCTPETTRNFTAVGYFFGKMLADSLNIPIGLINNAVGGAGTENFIDRKTLEYEFPAILRNWKKNDFIMEWSRGRAAKNVAKSTYALQRHPYEPCYLFESGVLPLAKYPVKGVVWYQGESNAHNFDTHTRLFTLLTQSWRGNWEKPELPFYFVQLSSLNRPSWPWFRDSQRRLQQLIPHTYMAVSHDVGDSLDVHPRNKRPVGERLARQALNHTYGKNITPCGPEYQSFEIQGSSIVLSFRYAAGMHGKDGQPLCCFEIAGEDQLFHPAQAEVMGDRIRVWSADVKEPKAVRYGWQPFTRANLVNADGIPASTFITTP